MTTLNYHWGLGSEKASTGVLFWPPSTTQLASLQLPAGSADSMCRLSPGALNPQCWEEELKSTQVSYEGEEVKTAQPLVPKLVLRSLPPEGSIGKLDILPLLDGFTRDAIMHPELVRFPDDEVEPDCPRPCLHLAAGEDPELFLCELHQLGLLRAIEESQVWHFGNKPVLNGMFAVREVTPEAKRVLIDGKLHDRQRLIMNLVPGKRRQTRLDADQGDLPYVRQWACLHLMEQEIFVGSERDRQCYLYCYRLPEVWGGCMAFAHSVRGHLVGQPDCDRVRVTSVCPGMGWVSAVGVTQ